MCHLILLMPVLGLVVFWIWPLSTALPIYLVILVTSISLWFAIMKAMHRPVVTGSEGMVGKTARVIQMTNHTGQVHVEGAIWEAVSDDDLRPGDKARIIGVDGLTLKIGKLPETRTVQK
jgi:membrane-bound serine protease (ClpP class)